MHGKGRQQKSMNILDANMILRYLLNDNAEMAEQTEQIIQHATVLILPEVIAEVVYVLKGVYKQERSVIAQGLLQFMQINSIVTNCKDVISVALRLYGEHNLDFVDCLLCAYHMEYGYVVRTFDRKLNRLIQETEKSVD